MGLTKHATPSATEIVSEFLDELLADYPQRDFQVRFWDGTIWGATLQPSFTLVLKHPGALREMLAEDTELSLAEAYIFDDVDIEGDIEAVLGLADYLLAHENHGFRQNLRLAGLLRQMPDRRGQRGRHRPHHFFGELHSNLRDRQAISYHYDLPPEFFALWLDHNMQYSAAYFMDEKDANLDWAQVRKLDYLCRKLRLRRGDRLLDIGCGWGALALYAAQNFGVEALGITLSVRQAEVARQRIRDAGLNQQCRIEVCDYRDLEAGQFDKIASIGMFEHVGQMRLEEYFTRVRELLRPGGVFLNSGIASSISTSRRQSASFIDRYVFPDGELVPISVGLGFAEQSGLEVRDLESLREHYAQTLRHWVRRLEMKAAEARSIVGDATYRVWRLYMAGSAHRFCSGELNLYHMLLVKPEESKSCVPLTRADWYQN